MIRFVFCAIYIATRNDNPPPALHADNCNRSLSHDFNQEWRRQNNRFTMQPGKESLRISTCIEEHSTMSHRIHNHIAAPQEVFVEL